MWTQKFRIELQRPHFLDSTKSPLAKDSFIIPQCQGTLVNCYKIVLEIKRTILAFLKCKNRHS